MRSWSTACSLVLVAACGTDPSGERVQRPFDTLLTCRDPGAPPIDTLEQAIAQVDINDDHQLTAHDLPREREGRAVIRLEGVHHATGQAAEAGLSVHADFDPEFYRDSYPDVTGWGIQVALGCLPVATVALSFLTEGDQLEVGSYPALGMGALVWTHEVMTGTDLDAFEVVGEIHITEVSEDGVSGWFEGRATGALYTRIPDEVPTGQVLTIEALAFHRVPIT